ncbi:MAG: SDR family NAD(P)-dependent oxidoreductase [Micrococcales bacterium]
MKQKTALVTGGSAGIGFQVAKQLLLAGYHVALTSRSSERAAMAARELIGLNSGTSDVIGLGLDLSDLYSVQALATEIAERDLQIDSVVTNAGVKIQRPFRKTAQGFEWHYGINHLGHYLLARELAKAGQHYHLTTVSSVVARLGDPKTWQIHDIDVGASSQYAASKLANLVLARAVLEKVPAWAENLTASAAHPGFTKAEPYGTFITRLGETLLAQSASAGAMPIVQAVHGNARQTSVEYLGPKRWELWGAPAPAKVPLSVTSEMCGHLVELSEEQLASAGF